MKTVQRSIMDFVDECAGELACRGKRTVTISKNYENTGYLYLDRLDTIHSVKFNFQTTACTMDYSSGLHQNYSYSNKQSMDNLRQHLRSWVKFGDPNVLR